LGEASEADKDYLGDLAAYIDHVQAAEERPAAEDAARRLESIASSMTLLRAEVERAKR